MLHLLFRKKMFPFIFVRMKSIWAFQVRSLEIKTPRFLTVGIGLIIMFSTTIGGNEEISIHFKLKFEPIIVN